jgi:hypothetical protein
MGTQADAVPKPWDSITEIEMIPVVMTGVNNCRELKYCHVLGVRL